MYVFNIFYRFWKVFPKKSFYTKFVSLTDLKFLDDKKNLVTPANLKQAFLLVPAKLRLVALGRF